jgi:hypothetical protein
MKSRYNIDKRFLFFWPDRRFFGLIVDRGRVYRGTSRLIADRGQADRGMVNFRDLTTIRPALIAD